MTMTELTLIAATEAALPEAPFQGRHLIGGEWRDSADGSTFDRLSPSHGILVSRSAKGGEADTEAAIMAARKAFDAGIWSRVSGKERADGRGDAGHGHVQSRSALAVDLQVQLGLS